MSTTMFPRAAGLACLAAAASHASSANAQAMVQTFPAKQVEMAKWTKVAKDASIKLA